MNNQESTSSPVSHHPDLARRARRMPKDPIRRWNRALVRASIAFSARSSFKKAEETKLTDSSVFVYRPDNAPDVAPALLWIHGGGLMTGDARQDGDFLTEVADQLGIVVASAQYRLAPGHPYPAPLDDCAEALEWLASQPGVDASRLMVGGQSAGGGLAAGLCQRQRLAGDVMPGFQLLVYPMLDDRSANGSGPNDHMFRLWGRKSNALGWSSYLRDQSPTAPAVPARLQDLSGLPPAWIGVGTADLFHDENVDYARRLEAAGVPVTLDIVDGGYHGFDVVDASADVSQQFRRTQIDVLARHLAERETDTPQS